MKDKFSDYRQKLQEKLNLTVIKEKALSNTGITVIAGVLIVIFLGSNFIQFSKDSPTEKSTGTWTKPTTKSGTVISMQENTNSTLQKHVLNASMGQNSMQQEINALKAEVGNLQSRIDILENNAKTQQILKGNLETQSYQVLGIRYDQEKEAWVADVMTSNGVKALTVGEELDGNKVLAITPKGIVTSSIQDNKLGRS